MRDKRSVWFAWTLCAVAIAGAAFSLMLTLNDPKTRTDILTFANALLNALFTIAFGVVGALIMARQPRNVIGWLLMTSGVSLSVAGALQNYPEQGVGDTLTPTLTTYLVIWFTGWSWWLLIGPLLLMLLVFPTGRLLTPRWRWVVGMVVLLFVTFLVLATISPVWQDINTGKTVPNPLGALSVNISFESIQLPWGIALVSTAMLSVLSVFVRYRRSDAVEREQLKWFLYTCAVFIAIYAVSFFRAGNLENWTGVLFDVAILLLPISIGIAILRHRLFDIDIIIRRTLVYSILTGILAVVYLSVVILLQQLFRALTGAGGELAIIISTLAIAALFNPLRKRVQDIIDRRFFRRKYDAQKVLAQFAQTARDETDLNKLTNELIRVVDETMQPQSVSVWLKPTKDSQRQTPDARGRTE